MTSSFQHNLDQHDTEHHDTEQHGVDQNDVDQNDAEQQDLDQDEPMRPWQRPLSYLLLFAGLGLLLTTKIIGSRSGDTFHSTANVGPWPLYVLGGVLLFASAIVGRDR